MNHGQYPTAYDFRTHPLSGGKRYLTLRKGAKVYTPRAGGVIEHGNGKRYEIDENGSTIRVERSETEETERLICGEFRRCGARLSKKSVSVYRSGDDEFVDVGKVRAIEAAELHSALRELPSNCGTERVLTLCKKLKNQTPKT